jgi:putative hydrolase of HD superfamily
VDNIISYAKILLNLARSGWMLRGIPSCLAETVAEHSFLTAFICIELGSKIGKVDIGKAVLYSLIHDIGEAFIGDIVKSFSARIKGFKDDIEMEYIDKNIDNIFIKELYKNYSIQNEFEAGLAKLCNYISTLLIGLEYKALGYRVNDIVENTCKEIKEMAMSLNIEDIVKKFLSDLLIICKEKSSE